MNIKDITMELFSRLHAEGIDYTVYNGYEKLPDAVDSDLDIAIEKKGLQILDTVLFDIAKKHHLLLLHKIWHDDKKYAYVLTPSRLIHSDRLQIDFFSEFSCRDFAGHLLSRFHLMDEYELLHDRERLEYFYIPSPHKEFMMKFLRRILKKDMNKQRFERLVVLYKKAPGKCKLEIEKYFRDQSHLILNAFEKQDYERLCSYMNFLRKELNKFRSNEFVLLKLFKLLERALFRIKYPVGMSVAVLGPDGCGKSTIAGKATEILLGSFHGQKLFYWRPDFLRQPGVVLRLRKGVKTGANPNPHEHLAEHPLKSFLRFSYYLLDFIFGYVLKTWPLLIKKHFCVFDRYYYDALVDSHRYNFSLPRWLLKIPISIIPKPNLTLILDVPVEILMKRKQELSLEELARQKTEFLKLAGKLPNAYIVNNARPMAEVIKEITGIIFLNKSYRTYSSLGFKQSGNKRYFKNLRNLFNIKNNENRGQRLIPFPTADFPRIFFAANNLKSFKASLRLYTPSRPFVKFFYANTPDWLLYPMLNRVSKRTFSANNLLLNEKIKSIFPSCKAISICTGAPGPHRKPLIQNIDEQGKVIGYFKLGINDETIALLEREEKSINCIRSMNLKTALFPEIIEKGKLNEDVSYLALNAVDTPFRESYEFTGCHIAFIKEILKNTAKRDILGETAFYKKLVKRVSFLEDKIPYYWTLRHKRILELHKDKKIPICRSHGDFTPWNAFVTSAGNLLLFDWEYSRENVAFSDFFHYEIQSAVFAQKKPMNTQSLLEHLEVQTDRWGIDKSVEYSCHWMVLLSIYLLEISSFYFERNYKTDFTERDLRLEIAWSKLLDQLSTVKKMTIL